MFLVLSIFFSGIAIGYLCRKIKLKKISMLIQILVFLLLFLLGIEVGFNKDLIHHFANLGIEAMAIAIAGTFGSILLARILWNKTNTGNQPRK